MHCGTSSFRRLSTTPVHNATCAGSGKGGGNLDLAHLTHSRASRERIDSARMPRLWENALNVQLGIIVTGATFQRVWGLPSLALKVPTEVKKEQMIHRNVSPSPFMHAAD